jgi:hypothetical protein
MTNLDIDMDLAAFHCQDSMAGNCSWEFVFGIEVGSHSLDIAGSEESVG